MRLEPPRYMGVRTELGSPDDILENERDKEPRAVVDAGGGRDLADTIKDDGNTDKFCPALWIPPLVQPERYRNKRAEDEGVEFRMIQRALAELSRRTQQTPA